MTGTNKDKEKKDCMFTEGNNVTKYSQTVWRFFKGPKIELAIPLLSIYPKDVKSVCGRDTCTPTFIAALLIIFGYRIDLSAQQQVHSWRKCGTLLS
jgi:hypothetical protein